MNWPTALRMLRTPLPPRGIQLPRLQAWQRRWQSRSSLAYEVLFSDYSARFRFTQTELARELETAFSLRSDSEITDYLEAFACRHAASVGVAHGVGTSSGTAALTLALLALGLKPGDEVLTPCYTYVATGLAVRNAGGVPVFVDAGPSASCLDLAALARRRSPRTRGVIVAHLFGAMSDPQPLLAYCRSQGLFLVEDACQAHGLSWRGIPAGSFGAAAAFSFNHTKLLSGLGNGGILVTRDPRLRDQARLLRDPESPTPLVLESRRTPCYLDPLQVACLRAQSVALERILTHHRKLSDVYLTGLAGLPLALPHPESPQAHTWYWFVIRTPRRDGLRAFLEKRGIDSRCGFFEPLARLPAFADLPSRCEPYPEAEKLWRESLALPIGVHLEEADVQRVVAAVTAFFGTGARGRG